MFKTYARFFVFLFCFFCFFNIKKYVFNLGVFVCIELKNALGQYILLLLDVHLRL